MGIGASDIQLVGRLQRDGYFHAGRVIVEIGAQQLSNDLLRAPNILEECGAAFGVGSYQRQLASAPRVVHGDLEELSSEAPFSKELWEWLGFSYNAVDLDGSPGAIPLDLNVDGVPNDMRKRATLVTNYGTTEHIANQLNAFKVIHDLTAEGGVMTHHLPAQGYLMHGLVNYNPKFFWALSAANGYKWLYARFTQSPISYPLPPDVVGEFQKYDDKAQELGATMTFRDSGIQLALQKPYDFEFVPPIDVPTGAEASNAVLRERYWTVFNKPEFHGQIEKIEEERARRRQP